MQRAQSLIDFLVANSGVTAPSFVPLILSVETQGYEVGATPKQIDQLYQVKLEINPVHKTRDHLSLSLLVKEWFALYGHLGESFSQSATEVDSLHLKVVFLLRLVERLSWSLILPEELASIPADSRIFYKGVEYKALEREDLIGI
ncbi:MAG: hypothetical protein A2600_08840 [Candidatus Lambdaproteobacteria bacterium RIFOXYD1_FULL_56_27]|uniref:Uncharacterized protein n=1 Tax=Candidatus Lambdaproteobacteria bacterium RIFOXYD2_FULL_56_26 TaxID=1817773 RepID=A0A1F6GZ49_9PROT|nr:MAG: hypothetical protein A2426_10260 [Candidatus Lambdaproteobacteria bacterium RIFOXYC1_FULL_56_13]OGH03359.1 MAG: hypothetical protein A2557_02425 [Candidatus Lambdaproteobacteria bacterium RIFOXYD2_FULL_56_26]OGH06636.1 MAG: hypothetical protein A2600_08840 [Candidatus Lambdaproteobacteria bacterium RIFOXYD1_FULL_56_27]